MKKSCLLIAVQNSKIFNKSSSLCQPFEPQLRPQRKLWLLSFQHWAPQWQTSYVQIESQKNTRGGKKKNRELSKRDIIGQVETCRWDYMWKQSNSNCCWYNCIIQRSKWLNKCLKKWKFDVKSSLMLIHFWGTFADLK